MDDELKQLLISTKDAIDNHLRSQRNITTRTNAPLVAASNRITERLEKENK
jgi:hypothetical protein